MVAKNRTIHMARSPDPQTYNKVVPCGQGANDNVAEIGLDLGAIAASRQSSPQERSPPERHQPRQLGGRPAEIGEATA